MIYPTGKKYFPNYKKLTPLEKVIFDDFFKCNHLIIKWNFVGKRTKNYFLKWAQYIGWKNAIGFVGKRNRLRWQMKAASLADESGFVDR